MKRQLFGVLMIFASLATAQAAVKGEEVSYQEGDTVMKGYVAYDDSIKGKRPGVLVIHEWWGQNEYPRMRARMLAELGYTALAVDMYGEGKVADHPGDAGKFSGEVKKNMPVARARFLAAREVLMKHASVDDTKIAAIGYCFGGSIVLEMARAGIDLDGVASFHGQLGTASPAQSGMVKAHVLVMNGADDPFIKPESIDAFKKEMDAAGVDYEFINYSGAKHAFTNPEADANGKKFNLPLAYNAEVDKQSWAKLQEFFEHIFH
jgi:dienelactone hydrolase